MFISIICHLEVHIMQNVILLFKNGKKQNKTKNRISHATSITSRQSVAAVDQLINHIFMKIEKCTNEQQHSNSKKKIIREFKLVSHHNKDKFEWATGRTNIFFK